MSVELANQLYNDCKDKERAYREAGYIELADRYKKEAEDIRKVSADDLYNNFGIYDAYRIGDVINKDLLKGKISKLNDFLLGKGKKVCGHCDRILTTDCFGRNSAQPDGLQFNCKECMNEMQKGRNRRGNKGMKKVKKDRLRPFQVGTYVTGDLIKQAHYASLQGLNRALSNRKRKVCHKCSIVRGFSDFEGHGNHRATVCNHCIKQQVPNSVVPIPKDVLDNINTIETPSLHKDTITNNILHTTHDHHTKAPSNASVLPTPTPNTGWICPVCNTALSPNVAVCPICHPDFYR